ncbi:MAG: hypothetical protein OXF29_01450 [Hyphomicrobiales bacterium]|nr:hypothetical protein [Hyphomicrobiales bacterium]
MEIIEAGNKAALSKNETAIERLRTDHEKAVGGLRTDHEKAVGGLRADHEKAVGGLRADMERGFKSLFLQLSGIIAFALTLLGFVLKW